MNLKSTFLNLVFFSLLAVVGGWCVDCSMADEGETKDPFAQVDPKDDPYGARRIPEALVNIGVDDSNNGNVIDFNTAFRDHKNNLVRTGDLFDNTRPVIMSFNYSDCPKLCSVQLEIRYLHPTIQLGFSSGGFALSRWRAGIDHENHRRVRF